jgi:hypothetical protein
MRSQQSAWIFNLTLRLGAIVCLGTLALGLFLWVQPLTALMRSGAAFAVFLLLGWAISTVWDVAVPEEGPAEADPVAPAAPAAGAQAVDAPTAQEAASGH